MAQRFQDLTGQVIKRATEVTRKIETDLIKILIEYVPAERRTKPASSDGLLNGSAIAPADGIDIAGSQAQVDDLLESLGF